MKILNAITSGLYVLLAILALYFGIIVNSNNTSSNSILIELIAILLLIAYIKINKGSKNDNY